MFCIVCRKWACVCCIMCKLSWDVNHSLASFEAYWEQADSSLEHHPLWFHTILDPGVPQQNFWGEPRHCPYRKPTGAVVGITQAFLFCCGDTHPNSERSFSESDKVVVKEDELIKCIPTVASLLYGLDFKSLQIRCLGRWCRDRTFLLILPKVEFVWLLVGVAHVF